MLCMVGCMRGPVAWSHEATSLDQAASPNGQAKRVRMSFQQGLQQSLPPHQQPNHRSGRLKVCACECRQQLVMMGSPCWAASPAKLAACWMSWQMCWVPLRASQLHKRVSTSSLYCILKLLLPAAVVSLALLRLSDERSPSMSVGIRSRSVPLMNFCMCPKPQNQAASAEHPY